MTPGELYMLSFCWASSTGALVGLGDIVASPDNITEVRSYLNFFCGYFNSFGSGPIWISAWEITGFVPQIPIT